MCDDKRTCCTDALWQVPKVEKDYGILLELRRHCLGLMVAGRRIGDVAGAASTFLSEKHPDLLGCLPKVRCLCVPFLITSIFIESWFRPGP